MASPDSDELDDPYGLVIGCLDDPGRGKSRLPRIVGLFDSDERPLRLCAAWACCLVANEADDETIEYLVRRLTDRLGEERVSSELTTTLDYISARYPEQVEELIETLEAEARKRGEMPLPRVGNFTRANYGTREHRREDVGRPRVAGAEEDSDSPVADAEREVGQPGDDSYRGGDTSTDDNGTTGERSGSMARERTEVTAIAARSRFDKLHVMATRQRDRYADTYEALVGTGGEEAAVALRLLHQPSQPAERRSFRLGIEDTLADWARVSNHGHVVSVLDWGVEPRPWLATELAGRALPDISQLSNERALTDAIALSSAVSALHNDGVVHGGIDPGNVIYPKDVVGSNATRPPFLDNVGLLEVLRFCFQPALLLDPRCSAPEYFDDRYGRIGPATDIYHLGAVIYYMFTGNPPFGGQFAEVRDGVLGTAPPAPSTVEESVPDGLDSIVAKAMAKQKLRRYETVEHLEQDLASLGGAPVDG
jgi:hypothetical protein